LAEFAGHLYQGRWCGVDHFRVIRWLPATFSAAGDLHHAAGATRVISVPALDIATPKGKLYSPQAPDLWIGASAYLQEYDGLLSGVRFERPLAS
jgi:hypothetical protein